MENGDGGLHQSSSSAPEGSSLLLTAGLAGALTQSSSGLCLWEAWLWVYQTALSCRAVSPGHQRGRSATAAHFLSADALYVHSDVSATSGGPVAASLAFFRWTRPGLNRRVLLFKTGSPSSLIHTHTHTAFISVGCPSPRDTLSSSTNGGVFQLSPLATVQTAE